MADPRFATLIFMLLVVGIAIERALRVLFKRQWRRGVSITLVIAWIAPAMILWEIVQFGRLSELLMHERSFAAVVGACGAFGGLGTCILLRRNGVALSYVTIAMSSVVWGFAICAAWQIQMYSQFGILGIVQTWIAWGLAGVAGVLPILYEGMGRYVENRVAPEDFR